ncbi:MAG: nitroreductase [Betaproteobacteria bacterium RIFCSPLOWO2_02_FULL_67_26]|nr:MAG: nitroreductase [Betaproteobacteria bacterium RIFCSPLOWO2_02_FULL_67_26]
MQKRMAVTSKPIHDLLASRWSTRAFDPARPVSRDQLATLLEAGRWAPSCNGDEPWRYLIWDRKRDPEGFQKAFDCLSENNRKWVKNVPLLMLSCAGSNFEATGKPNRWTQHDTGAASVSMALQAEAMGLMVHQMGGYDAEKARAAFSVPAEYTPMAMIAVGYPTGPEILDEETKAKELRPRGRKPLAERFFEGGWGKGFAA